MSGNNHLNHEPPADLIESIMENSAMADRLGDKFALVAEETSEARDLVGAAFAIDQDAERVYDAGIAAVDRGIDLVIIGRTDDGISTLTHGLGLLRHARETDRSDNDLQSRAGKRVVGILGMVVLEPARLGEHIQLNREYLRRISGSSSETLRSGRGGELPFPPCPSFPSKGGETKVLSEHCK